MGDSSEYPAKKLAPFQHKTILKVTMAAFRHWKKNKMCPVACVFREGYHGRCMCGKFVASEPFPGHRGVDKKRTLLRV